MKIGTPMSASRNLPASRLLRSIASRLPLEPRKLPVKKVIPFPNDDVPNYLRELDKFEERSRQTNLVVG